MSLEELGREFFERYKRPGRLFYAPGRINLIGEHTDYNQGFVLPFALDRGTTVAATSRADRRVNVFSVNRSEAASFNLDEPWTTRRGTWVDYVEGTARSLGQAGVVLTGADLLLHSELPLGAGLSSSAALEVSVAMALSSVSSHTASARVLVEAAHRAETEYVGTQSGIMDPYVAVHGKRNRCLLIDCQSVTSEEIPLELDNVAIVVCDTGVKHLLASSAYNQRRAECQEGVDRLRNYLPSIRSLRDVSAQDLLMHTGDLPETILKRCRHVIMENERTLAATKALSARDFSALGCLMFQSHESLRVDYEVTSPELDLLVDTAQLCEGVLGSRMTGGGFGGCTITLVQRTAVDSLIATLRDAFEDRFQVEPQFLVPAPGDGARAI